MKLILFGGIVGVTILLAIMLTAAGLTFCIVGRKKDHSIKGIANTIHWMTVNGFICGLVGYFFSPQIFGRATNLLLSKGMSLHQCWLVAGGYVVGSAMTAIFYGLVLFPGICIRIANSKYGIQLPKYATDEWAALFRGK